MKQSEFLSLGFRDFLRGFVMAVLTPIFVIVQQSLEAGILTFNWQSIAMAGVAGAFTTDKTYFFGLKTGSLSDVSAQWINTDQIVINTADNTTSPFTQSDDKLGKTTFEIRVYN